MEVGVVTPECPVEVQVAEHGHHRGYVVDKPAMVEPGLITWLQVRGGSNPAVLRQGNAPDACELAGQTRQELPFVRLRLPAYCSRSTWASTVSAKFRSPPLSVPAIKSALRTWGALDLPDCGSFRIFTGKDGIKCRRNTGTSHRSSVRKRPGWSSRRRVLSRTWRGNSGSARPAWVTGCGRTGKSTRQTSRRCSCPSGPGSASSSGRTASWKWRILS